MSSDRYAALIGELCEAIGLPDTAAVLERKSIETDGFEVLLNHYENDADALYLNFHFGIVTAGRTLRVFRMMLEANLNLYAQDQAQLGIDPDTTGIVLIVRIPMGDDVDGPWLADTLGHYAEHGRYWKTNISEATEEMFLGVASGDYQWIRA